MKIMYKFGVGVTVIWAIVCIYLAITAVGIQLLIPFMIFISGGYALIAYFLIVCALKRKDWRKKGLMLILAFLWIMTPVFKQGIDAWQSHQHQVKLERTTPTAELVQDSFNGYNNEYIQLKGNSYDNGILLIQVEINEENFKKGYRKFKREVFDEVSEEYSGEELDEAWLEIAQEDFFSEVFSVHRMQFEIWRQTTMPEKIVTELYYKGKVFHTINSTRSYGETESMHSFDKTKILIHDLTD